LVAARTLVGAVDVQHHRLDLLALLNISEVSSSGKVRDAAAVYALYADRPRVMMFHYT
jgi:hypothetical protein